MQIPARCVERTGNVTVSHRPREPLGDVPGPDQGFRRVVDPDLHPDQPFQVAGDVDNLVVHRRWGQVSAAVLPLHQLFPGHIGYRVPEVPGDPEDGEAPFPDGPGALVLLAEMVQMVFEVRFDLDIWSHVQQTSHDCV
jgi:hypothetical protein